MAENEERKLQIRIAQLNAYLQLSITAFFGSVAAAIAFIILGWEIISSPFSVVIFTVAAIVLFVASYFLYRLNGFLEDFRNLQ